MSKPRKSWIISGLIYSDTHTDAFSIQKAVDDALRPHGLELSLTNINYNRINYSTRPNPKGNTR